MSEGNTEIIEREKKKAYEEGLRNGETEATLGSIQKAVEKLDKNMMTMEDRLRTLEIRVYTIATLINLGIAFAFQYFK